MQCFKFKSYHCHCKTQICVQPDIIKFGITKIMTLGCKIRIRIIKV